ncbi:MAG: sigma-54 dependent transcriptional regulator [Planctomycetes bacterium]|nr:sigma-54 dependent transcriptional regulator [Planctomycetota bacterium]
MSKKKLEILLAEDEKSIRITLADDLRDANYKVKTAVDGNEAMQAIEDDIYDIIITDIRMPGPDGLQILKHVKEVRPETEVIIITGVPTYELAVECVKYGAYDFIAKPFSNDELINRLDKLKELVKLRRENLNLRSQIDSSFKFDNLIGRSAKMQRIFDEIRTVASSDVPILLKGDSGTGKELFARAIHHNSTRNNRPFVTVACHIANANLIEDTLFGHIKGAYTSATGERRGKFEDANGGTIFLDDIDDLPFEIQSKLLRVLQFGEIERLGADDVKKVDVRIIAATKVDLTDLIDEGKFREDLYYRLNVLQVEIPSLRQRIDDIPLLVHHFIKTHGMGKDYEIEDEALLILQQYHWPGNVRELESAVRASIALAGKTNILKKEHFMRNISKTHTNKIEEPLSLGSMVTLAEAVESIERGHILRVLKFTGGNTVKAAEILGISRKTLWDKRKKHQIEL